METSIAPSDLSDHIIPPLLLGNRHPETNMNSQTDKTKRQKNLKSKEKFFQNIRFMSNYFMNSMQSFSGL